MSASEPHSPHEERLLAQGLHLNYQERCAIYRTAMGRLPRHLELRVAALGRHYEEGLEPGARRIVMEAAGESPTPEALCKRTGLRFLDQQLDETTVLAGERIAGRIHEWGERYGIAPLDAGVIAGLLCEDAWARVQHGVMRDYLSSASVPAGTIDSLIGTADDISPLSAMVGALDRQHGKATQAIRFTDAHAPQADNGNYARRR